MSIRSFIKSRISGASAQDEKRPYNPHYPFPYATYSPWFEDDFRSDYDRIKDNTVCREDRCYMVREFCRHALSLPGDIAECGVYKGGTAYLIAKLMRETGNDNRTLHLFDTFGGMPKTADADPSVHKEGDFGDLTLESVQDFINAPFAVYHPGFMPDTFAGLQDNQFPFVHIDVDLYQSVYDCCVFFYDRVLSGGVMLFDDYGFEGYRLSAKKAVDDFFKDKPEQPISLGTSQCLVLRQ